MGIEPARIQVIGLGESNPIADNSTEEGRAENRQVEVTLMTPQTEMPSLPEKTTK
ncbi:TPA: hypothetical protein ACX6O7_003741 [Photobacterium damselae]